MTPHTLRQLAWFAAHHFAQTGDFTVLHMVTGCRAVRVLLTAVPGSEPWALACLVPAFTAAFLSSGIGRTAPLSSIEGEAPEWSDVVNAALRSDDDHLAKIVHACSDEAAAHANPAYLQAACRAVSVRGE